MIFNFAYARVSTDEQETERQKQAIKEYCPEIEEKDIFIDKATGKNFDRPSYQLMKSLLREYQQKKIKWS